MAEPHKYGPHRPEDAPTMIEVGAPGRRAYPPTIMVPIARALIRQRAQLNTLAARHGGRGGGLCRVCGRDEYACRWVRPGPDPHSYEPSR